MKEKNYTDINAETIDSWVKSGWEWGIPITHEKYLDATNGKWEMVLTPTKPVPKNWFPTSLKRLKVLGLASGGGQQMPIFAALGAICTVLDYSLLQLESEQMVANREGYSIEIIRADMTKPLPFIDATFDLIFHPVSNCYVKEVEPIFKECYRILKPGGILLAGLDNNVNYLSDDENFINNKLPFDPLVNPEQMEMLKATDSGVQFSHTLEEQIGGQLKAGFILTHIYDDINGSGRLHDLNIPTFFATRAVKPK
ncbi:MAG TPA: methyltransferase domain-containing protein [Bacilli bacterium]|nr:methyltransferase domain-containing protein [Bacilli bacterium]